MVKTDNKAEDFFLNGEEEVEALKREIEHFKQEKDRVRAIVGQIGGVPASNARVLNIFFIVFVVICLTVPLLSGGILRLAMPECAIAALSMKMIYLIHSQSRVNHFQLWISASLEWQVNEMTKILKELKKED